MPNELTPEVCAVLDALHDKEQTAEYLTQRIETLENELSKLRVQLQNVQVSLCHLRVHHLQLTRPI